MGLCDRPISFPVKVNTAFWLFSLAFVCCPHRSTPNLPDSLTKAMSRWRGLLSCFFFHFAPHTSRGCGCGVDFFGLRVSGRSPRCGLTYFFLSLAFPHSLLMDNRIPLRNGFVCDIPVVTTDSIPVHQSSGRCRRTLSSSSFPVLVCAPRITRSVDVLMTCFSGLNYCHPM